MIVYLNSTVSPDDGAARIACSTQVGCDVVLAASERLRSVTIDNERFLVRIVSNGDHAPIRLHITPPSSSSKGAHLSISTIKNNAYGVAISPTTALTWRAVTFSLPTPKECLTSDMLHVPSYCPQNEHDSRVHIDPPPESQ